MNQYYYLFYDIPDGETKYPDTIQLDYYEIIITNDIMEEIKEEGYFVIVWDTLL